MSDRDKANQFLLYILCGLALAIIAGMFSLTFQERECPPAFENFVLLILGGIVGALKLQNSNNSNS
jgi:hypothetical protein